MIYVNEEAPAIVLPTTSGSDFSLAGSNPEKFNIIIFYRGKHCPLCATFLEDIENHIDVAKESGMEVVAISMDGKERAIQTNEAIASKLGKSSLSFPIAYNLSEKQARAWGLYISSARAGSSEPIVFSEPGMFVLRPDNTVFMAQVQSAPFTRPDIRQLVGGLNFAYANNYPARGDLTKV